MQKSYVLQDFSIFRRQFRANWLTILDYIAQIGGGAFSQIDFDIFVKLKKFSKLRAGGGGGNLGLSMSTMRRKRKQVSKLHSDKCLAGTERFLIKPKCSLFSSFRFHF